LLDASEKRGRMMFKVEDLEKLFYYLRVMRFVTDVQFIDQNTISYRRLNGDVVLANIEMLFNEMEKDHALLMKGA
jgi:hypothetical protein